MSPTGRLNLHQLLRQGFSSFVRRRREMQHFERLPLAGTARKPALAAQALGQELLAAAAGEPAAALTLLKSQLGGLSAADAALRLARDGPNDIQPEPPLPAWLHLGRCYLKPFNVLLTALALLFFLSSDAKAMVVISVMVALSTVIRLVQEGRSHRAAESLRATRPACCARRLQHCSKSCCEDAPLFVIVGLQREDVNCVNAKPVTVGRRMHKSAAEIALMQRAHDMTMAVHRAAASMIKVGVMTTEVEAFIAAAHRAVRASGSYFCIVLFGVANSFPHGVKEARPPCEGDMVLIDPSAWCMAIWLTSRAAMFTASPVRANARFGCWRKQRQRPPLPQRSWEPLAEL